MVTVSVVSTTVTLTVLAVNSQIPIRSTVQVKRVGDTVDRVVQVDRVVLTAKTHTQVKAIVLKLFKAALTVAAVGVQAQAGVQAQEAQEDYA